MRQDFARMTGRRYGEGVMRKLVRTALVLAACSFLPATPAFAQAEQSDEYMCRNGAFPDENKQYRLAKVKGAAGDKVHFYGDSHKRCPAGEGCRLQSYVVPNDEVIVSRTYGTFACSWFQPRKGSETVGWIETDRLAWTEVNRQPAEREWLGEWRGWDNNYIRISKAREGGALTIVGHATWATGAPNEHSGELDYSAKPSGDRLSFSDGDHENDCRVAMQLVGKYLVVKDNVRCGGVNVSFSGIYLKRARR
jgi:hypothetical protein